MKQEEKLKEAKRLYESANAEQRYVLESLFPELKENEDERIRTGLINGFKECLKNSQYPKNAQKYWHNIKIEDILAWLEKQGQAKESQASQHDNKTCKENGNSLINEDEKMIRRIIEALQRYMPTDELWEEQEMVDWLEKQAPKSQRIISAEAKEELYDKFAWSEEDDENIMMIEDRFSDYLDYIREDSSLTKHRKNTIKEEVIGYVNWLKQLKRRMEDKL